MRKSVAQRQLKFQRRNPTQLPRVSFQRDPTHPYSQEIQFSNQVEQNHQVHRYSSKVLPHSNTVELYAKLYLSLCLVVLDPEQQLHISSETQCQLAWNKISVENTKHIKVNAILDFELIRRSFYLKIILRYLKSWCQTEKC